MSLQPLDLTTALRPSLLPDETLLFVQDAVGLYEGKFKIPAFQNGHAYLTSHRACYVDNVEPRKSSVAINLKDVERFEFYAGFLKSSPKVTLYPKTSQRPGFPNQGRAATTAPEQGGHLLSPYISSSNTNRASSPLAAPQLQVSTQKTNTATWICPICSYSNPIASNFDAASANAHTPLAPCLACGIKPPLAHVLKAAIANASGRSHASQSPVRPSSANLQRDTTGGSFNGHRPAANGPGSPAGASRFQCPRCTFQNHPSLLECELCGAPLVSAEDAYSEMASTTPARPESPGPSLDGQAPTLDHHRDGIKFSFRAGGAQIFYERLKGAMTQRKWLLQNAPPIPQTEQSFPDSGSDRRPSQNPPIKVVGIAGLERRGLELRKKNETVIGNAFEDLEALMASAKEVVALAERFAQKSADKGTDGDELLVESATALGMVTTKDMLGSRTGSESLYLSELSRNVAEYLTDDAKGVLKKEGGIVSLVDLWALFNRTRGGVELVSPADFEKAARLWDKLSLPVRLRQFKNGLLVVQRHDWTDDKTIAQLLAWLQELHTVPPVEKTGWDGRVFGRGVTAQEAAVRFGWSIGVAGEELEMAEEKGALCRDEGVEGIKYWENWLLHEAEVDGQQDLTLTAGL
ncbi:Vacuolar protein-sorting-associated protein 36 [Xanthoria parietina]